MTQSIHDQTLVVSAVCSGILFLFFLDISALQLNGGIFDDPLDDVYIHLTMAEGIGRGVFGINPADISGAYSSVIYPLLLLPVLPLEFQRLLLVFWNFIAIWTVLALSDRVRSSSFKLLAMMLIFVGLGHLFLGQIGWLNRYEQYILLTLAAGVLFLTGGVVEKINRALLTLFVVVSLLVSAIWYLPEVIIIFPVNAGTINTRQGQKSTFAKAQLLAAVAVNDIGWVARNNPSYVLDLWGLVSNDVLVLRLSESDMEWAGKLAKRNSAQVL